MLKVLHVDDEPAVSARVHEQLEPHFEWVGAVGDGDTVLDVVAKLRPDVILLDISLPGRGGFDLARELRRSWPDVKVIFLTVHSDEAYVQEAIRIGVTGYVVKGAIASELVSAIHEVARGGTFISAGLPRV